MTNYEDVCPICCCPQARWQEVVDGDILTFTKCACTSTWEDTRGNLSGIRPSGVAFTIMPPTEEK